MPLFHRAAVFAFTYCLIWGCPMFAVTRYVDASNPFPQAPYTNWQTAANVLQAAVFTATAGDTILVTNGIYNQGRSFANPSRITLSKKLSLLSVNGPEFTTIEGYQDPSDPVGKTSLRCITASTPVLISGFKLTLGGTDTSGGGILGTASGIILSNCIIEGNAAKQEGGGATGVTLLSCLLKTNRTVYTAFSAGSLGGGAYLCEMKDCTLEGNYSYLGGGAALSTLIQCRILTNVGGVGGGVYYSSVSQSIVAGNQALGLGGGGADRCNLYQCHILGNHSDWQAGGVSGGRLWESRVVGNTSRSNGGGIAEAFATNCVIVGNVSGERGGGAYDSELHHCTVADNLAKDGGGLFSGHITNSIVYQNYASESGANYAGDAEMGFTCTTPLPPSGALILTSDPQFIDSSVGNYRLNPNSPCIDVAEPFVTVSHVDGDGRPRWVGFRPDLGAYEWSSEVDGNFLGYLAQYALPTNGAVDREDTDLDGVSNLDEWRAKTNPLDASSLLRMGTLSIGRSAKEVVIEWQSVPGLSYYVEYAPALVVPLSFQRIASGVLSASRSTQFIHGTDTRLGMGFYRVGVE